MQLEARLASRLGLRGSLSCNGQGPFDVRVLPARSADCHKPFPLLWNQHASRIRLVHCGSGAAFHAPVLYSCVAYPLCVARAGARLYWLMLSAKSCLHSFAAIVPGPYPNATGSEPQQGCRARKLSMIECSKDFMGH
eukprot:1053201-Amphidinium_carterae.1